MSNEANICEECGLPMVECSAIASARRRCEEYLREAGYAPLLARQKSEILVPDPKTRTDIVMVDASLKLGRQGA